MRAAGWAAFFVLGLLLVILGATGRIGSGIAAIITPASLDDVTAPAPGDNSNTSFTE